MPCLESDERGWYDAGSAEERRMVSNGAGGEGLEKLAREGTVEKRGGEASLESIERRDSTQTEGGVARVVNEWKKRSRDPSRGALFNNGRNDRGDK